jgi:hypothetical protein
MRHLSTIQIYKPLSGIKNLVIAFLSVTQCFEQDFSRNWRLCFEKDCSDWIRTHSTWESIADWMPPHCSEVSIRRSVWRFTSLIVRKKLPTKLSWGLNKNWKGRNTSGRNCLHWVGKQRFIRDCVWSLLMKQNRVFHYSARVLCMIQRKEGRCKT